jgi:hypothetical protein
LSCGLSLRLDAIARLIAAARHDLADLLPAPRGDATRAILMAQRIEQR